MFYTSGVYTPGAPAEYGADYHSTYLTWWLNFVGVTEVESIRFQPSLLTEDPAGEQARALARAEALGAAAS